jgi:multidrug efflux pump subunit AcrA (membrane-fusion protein)
MASGGTLKALRLILKFLKRHPIWCGAGILLLGWLLWLGLRKKPVAQFPEGVRQTAKVAKANITDKIEETANLAPMTMVRVKANATGMVRQLKVEAGDYVKAGQLLAVIQPGRPGEQYKTSPVLAPMSGVVTERNVEEGDIATSSLSDYGSGTVLMTIAKLDVMVASFEINEVDIAKVKKGMPASLRLEALPGSKFPGKILALSPAARPLPGSSLNTFAAKIILDGSHAELKPGMSSIVVVEIASKKGVLSLPVDAVFNDKEGMHVYLAKGRGFEQKEVKVGIADNDNVEIVDGLKEGDEVSKVRPLDEIPSRAD